MIETVPTIGSTNTALVARLAAGAAPGEGYWLVADRQSAGRGRAGRAWSDGYGNFMGSTLVQLVAGDPPAPTLSLVAGVALHRALAGVTGHAPGIMLKWPNDVLVNGAKLAGILAEQQGQAVVVGIGVNLVQAPEVADRETVALAALGHAVPRDAFAQTLAAAFADVLRVWHAGEWPALRDEWQARAHPVGAPIAVRDPQAGTVTGHFAGLDAGGAALLRLADGSCRAIHAGDIELGTA